MKKKDLLDKFKNVSIVFDSEEEFESFKKKLNKMKISYPDITYGGRKAFKIVSDKKIVFSELGPFDTSITYKAVEKALEEEGD